MLLTPCEQKTNIASLRHAPLNTQVLKEQEKRDGILVAHVFLNRPRYMICLRERDNSRKLLVDQLENQWKFASQEESNNQRKLLVEQQDYQ